MVTERLRRMIDIITKLPPEEQDRVAAAMQAMLEQPPVISDDVRPDVLAAVEKAMDHSTNALDYLRDK